MHNIPQTKKISRYKKWLEITTADAAPELWGRRNQESPICQLRLGVSSGKLFLMSSPRKRKLPFPLTRNLSQGLYVCVWFLIEGNNCASRPTFCWMWSWSKFTKFREGISLLLVRGVPSSPDPERTRSTCSNPSNANWASPLVFFPPVSACRRLILSLTGLIHYMRHRLSEP